MTFARLSNFPWVLESKEFIRSSSGVHQELIGVHQDSGVYHVYLTFCLNFFLNFYPYFMSQENKINPFPKCWSDMSSALVLCCSTVQLCCPLLLADPLLSLVTALLITRPGGQNNWTTIRKLNCLNFSQAQRLSVQQCWAPTPTRQKIIVVLL